MTTTTVGLITGPGFEDTVVRLRRRGFKVIVPDAFGRHLVERIVRDELRMGQFITSSRRSLVDEIGALGLRGAGAVALGCPELRKVIDETNSPLPIIDVPTTSVAATRSFLIG